MSCRRRSEIEFSMFPFLSVLCAVIGILMLLLIAVMSTRVIATDASMWPGGTEEALELQTPGISEEQYEALTGEVEQLGRRLAECDARRRQLAQLRARLDGLIAGKEDLAQLGPAGMRREGTRLGMPEAVRVVPDPTRTVSKTPILVEVDAFGYTVYPGRTKYAGDELDRGDSPLRRFLDQVDAARQRQYLVLLLHPSGVASYDRLRQFLHGQYGEDVRVGGKLQRKSRIDLGVEPFSDRWLLEPDES
jgi:hypothetical protein